MGLKRCELLNRILYSPAVRVPGLPGIRLIMSGSWRMGKYEYVYLSYVVVPNEIRSRYNLVNLSYLSFIEDQIRRDGKWPSL